MQSQALLGTVIMVRVKDTHSAAANKKRGKGNKEEINRLKTMIAEMSAQLNEARQQSTAKGTKNSTKGGAGDFYQGQGKGDAAAAAQQ